MTDAHITPDPTQAAKAKPQRKETENDRARQFGIPKWLKQYNARYGKGGVEGILACHLQNEAPMIDHGRERGEQLRAAVIALQAAQTSVELRETIAREADEAAQGHGHITGTADVDAMNAAAYREYDTNDKT